MLLDGGDVPVVDRGPAGAAPGAERYTCVGDTFTSSGSYYSNVSARVS